MSKLDIINRALTRIGAENLTVLTGTGKTVMAANLMYQAAVDFVLRTNPWACAVSIVRLSTETEIARRQGQQYLLDDLYICNGILYQCTAGGITAYGPGPSTMAAGIVDGTSTWTALEEVPENLTEFDNMYVYPLDCLKIRSVGETAYLVMGWFIFTDELEAKARVIKRVYNTDSLDTLLLGAIVAKLAELLAPTFGQNAIINQLIGEYALALKIARAESASEAQEDAPAVPLWTDL